MGSNNQMTMYESGVALTQLPVPRLLTEQLAEIVVDSALIRNVGEFNPTEAVDALDHNSGSRVVAVDIGGDSVVANEYEVTDGTVVESQELLHFNSTGGEGYLDALVEASALAGDLPVGISTAGLLDGTRIVQSTNLKGFMRDLHEEHGGDMRGIFPNLAALHNDAIAGLIYGSIEAERARGATSVIYLINGSGIGAAVLHNGKLNRTEVGHVKVVKALNPYDQSILCDMAGDAYTCIELVGGAKAGISSIYEQQTGRPYSGKEVELMYRQGDILARNLYDNSALLAAHAISGLATVLGVKLADPSTTIVGHGGGFKFPEYGARIQQILTLDVLRRPFRTKGEPHLIMTHDLALKNACLGGAAIAAALEVVKTT